MTRWWISSGSARTRDRARAILGLLLLTALVLWIAALAVQRMQISYGAET
jgi:hypothetical protein